MCVMHVYIYIYMLASMHVCMLCGHAYMYVCVWRDVVSRCVMRRVLLIYVCLHARGVICTHVCLSVCLLAFNLLFACLHIRTHACMYVLYIYIYMYTCLFPVLLSLSLLSCRFPSASIRLQSFAVSFVSGLPCLCLLPCPHVLPS